MENDVRSHHDSSGGFSFYVILYCAKIEPTIYSVYNDSQKGGVLDVFFSQEEVTGTGSGDGGAVYGSCAAPGREGGASCGDGG